jgi:DNA repair protein RadA/Sms
MARSSTVFVCSSCGREEPRWLGRCPGCGAWSTLTEERAPADARAAAPRRRAAARPVQPLAEVGLETTVRIATGIDELDRVLGGGLVPGSLVLLGGEPGVGKSSLTTAMLSRVGAARRTLLVTGEESPAQVRLRAERLGALTGVSVLAETELDTVCATIEAERPAVCVVDSVQTLWAEELGSAPGSVAQVREAASRLLRVAKTRGTAIVLVGHVTKEGTVAGPRVLEHLVDVTLMFEGDALRALRVLRAQKNRFGATDEIGLFEMTGRGLESVADASRLHDRADLDRPGACALVAIEGTRPLLLDVQALVSPSDLAMPRRLASGFDRNRLSLLLAVLGRHARLGLGQHDVFVNVSGGVRVDEPAADLAVVLALASAARGVALGPLCAFGEVALTGRLRPAPQAERRLTEAARLGLSRAIVPDGTPRSGALRASRVSTLASALEAALGVEPPRPRRGLELVEPDGVPEPEPAPA